MTDFHGDEAKKKKIETKGPKWPTQKKLSFSIPPDSQYFFTKIHYHRVSINMRYPVEKTFKGKFFHVVVKKL